MARVLIIEPDENVRLLLAVQVQTLGHEPVVLDGVVPAWPGDDFDAAIIEPATLAGLRFAEGLRAVDGVVPIVFASIQEPSAETRALGPAVHVVKPFRLADLGEALRAALSSGRETQPAPLRLRPRPRDCSDERA